MGHNLLAKIYIGQGRFAKAEGHLRKALELEQGSWEAIRKKARERAAQKEEERAAFVRSQVNDMSSGEEFDENSYLTEMFPPEVLKKRIMPFGKFRFFWDLFTLVLVLFTAISLPLVLFFKMAPGDLHGPDPCNPSHGDNFLAFLDVFMDFVFLFDIGLNFKTAVVLDGRLIIEYKQIAKIYAVSARRSARSVTSLPTAVPLLPSP